MPVRFGVRQQTQLPRIALAYPDCANRARYQAVTPAVCRSAGWYSLADNGRSGTPLDVRTLLRACDTATGSSTSPSSWLVIQSGTVPAALTWAIHVCHCCDRANGVNANDGPTISAFGAMRRSSRNAESHIWKYCVLFTLPPGQNTEMSGSL